MKEQSVSGRAIPSLDGFRALSVIAVILGHTESPWLDRIPFGSSLRNGHQGVVVFFAISGFLITNLLLKELRHEGQINLKRFYFRRTFRIFPPFYVFLLVVAGLYAFHKIVLQGSCLIAAGTYTWNYWRFSGDKWALGHCWSLALEEQFYLLWPACMKLFSRRTNLWIATGVVVLSPLVRVVNYSVWPAMRENSEMMLHTHLDGIMMGCLAALLIDLDLLRGVRQLALYTISPVIAIAFLMCIDTPATLRWHGEYLLPIGYSLQSLAVVALLLFGVFRHQSLLGKFLNLAFVRHIGMISYSLYLWQQLFTGPYTRLFPLNVLFIFACAEASYFLVERPSSRLRDIVQRRLFPLSKEHIAKRSDMVRDMA